MVVFDIQLCVDMHCSGRFQLLEPLIFVAQMRILCLYRNLSRSVHCRRNAGHCRIDDTGLQAEQNGGTGSFIWRISSQRKTENTRHNLRPCCWYKCTFWWYLWMQITWHDDSSSISRKRPNSAIPSFHLDSDNTSILFWTSVSAPEGKTLEMEEISCLYGSLLKSVHHVDVYRPWTAEAYVAVAQHWLQNQPDGVSCERASKTFRLRPPDYSDSEEGSWTMLSLLKLCKLVSWRKSISLSLSFLCRCIILIIIQVTMPRNAQHGSDQQQAIANAMAYIHLSSQAAVKLHSCHQKDVKNFFTPVTFQQLVHVFKLIAVKIRQQATVLFVDWCRKHFKFDVYFSRWHEQKYLFVTSAWRYQKLPSAVNFSGSDWEVFMLFGSCERSQWYNYRLEEQSVGVGSASRQSSLRCAAVCRSRRTGTGAVHKGTGCLWFSVCFAFRNWFH